MRDSVQCYVEGFPARLKGREGEGLVLQGSICVAVIRVLTQSCTAPSRMTTVCFAL